MNERNTSSGSGWDDRSIDRYRQLITSFPELTKVREDQLSAIVTGPPGKVRDQAIMELVNCNLKRVLSLTKKYKTYSQYMDIVCDGNLGLVRAAADFDSAKGRFSTHATYRIKTAIREGMRTRIGTAYVPRTISDMVMRIRKIARSSEKSNEELAAELDIGIKDVVAARLAMLAMLDHIQMVTSDDGMDDEKPLIAEDPNSLTWLTEIEQRDLCSLVERAANDLGLSREELILVSEAHGRYDSGTKMASKLAGICGVGAAALRMRRAKLVWAIRRKIFEYVGAKEYLALSSTGRLPAHHWEEEKKSKRRAKTATIPKART